MSPRVNALARRSEEQLIPASNLVNASMSKTDLLMICQYWASPYITLPSKPEKDPERLRFGSAFHKCAEIYLEGRGKKKPNFKAVAKKYDVPELRLRDFYARWKVFIDNVLTKQFPGMKWRIEEKLAYDPFLDKTRFLTSTKERDYSQRGPNELPGTGDLILVPENEDFFVVFDWKTGSSDYDAQMNGQLASLALAMSRHLKRYRALVYIVRIDDDFIQTYPDDRPAELRLEDLERHRLRLRSKIADARSMTPAMRPGLHCKGLYCPMLETCPSQQSPMSLGDALHAMDPEKKAFYFAQYKAAEKLIEIIGERFKREIEMNGPFQLEDGRWAWLEEQTKENLSKASIRRALGVVDGEDVIKQLNDRGCIDETKYMKITYGKNPPGTPAKLSAPITKQLKGK